MELEVSTTPRETWLWAASSAEADRLRALLSAAGHVVLEPDLPAASEEAKGYEPGRIIDIEIGATAADALDTVRAAGYTLRWHPRQASPNRGTLFGELVPE